MKKNTPSFYLENLMVNNPEIFELISVVYDSGTATKLDESNNIESDEGTYPNTPKMQEMVKIAKAIKKSLPAIPKGYIRLWRGNREGEVGKNPSYTNSLAGIALPYLSRISWTVVLY